MNFFHFLKNSMVGDEQEKYARGKLTSRDCFRLMMIKINFSNENFKGNVFFKDGNGSGKFSV